MCAKKAVEAHGLHQQLFSLLTEKSESSYQTPVLGSGLYGWMLVWLSEGENGWGREKKNHFIHHLNCGATRHV